MKAYLISFFFQFSNCLKVKHKMHQLRLILIKFNFIQNHFYKHFSYTIDNFFNQRFVFFIKVEER